MIPEPVRLVINTITDSQQKTKHINWEIPEVKNRSIFTRVFAERHGGLLVRA